MALWHVVSCTQRINTSHTEVLYLLIWVIISVLLLPPSAFVLSPFSCLLPPSSFLRPLVHAAADHFVHVWRLRRVIDPLINPLSPSQRYKPLGWRNAGDFEEDYPIKGMARCGEKLLMAAGVNIYSNFQYQVSMRICMDKP